MALDDSIMALPMLQRSARRVGLLNSIEFPREHRLGSLAYHKQTVKDSQVEQTMPPLAVQRDTTGPMQVFGLA